METDEELLGRIAGGDAEAFDRLHARLRDQVLRHALRIVADGDAAEDVTQETFLRVWRKACQWERRGSARGWILRIAANLSLNLLDSRRRTGRLVRPASDEEDAEDILSRIADSAGTGPLESLERADTRRLIRESVESLPEGKRQVMDLYLDGDVTLAQIARRLGLPVGTVKSRFHYAVRELRELLDGFSE